jgi:nitrogenase-associated protein
MSELTFYEKPGCVGNQKQKELLLSMGHKLEVKDLLQEEWSAERLRPFFGDRPITEWFNQSAPQIREGWISPGRLNERRALKVMLLEPLLIRRPLLEFGSLKQSGFEPGPVLTALGVSLDPEEDLQSCPMPGASPECDEVG